jgi:hypothetical protein
MVTWLGHADALLDAAKRAQDAGDQAATLELALEGAKCLQIHKNLEAARAYLDNASASPEQRAPSR